MKDYHLLCDVVTVAGRGLSTRWLRYSVTTTTTHAFVDELKKWEISAG